MTHPDHPKKAAEHGHEKNPRTADEQETPEPERPQTIQEAEGQAARVQEDPPKAEGNRDETEPESGRHRD